MTESGGHVMYKASRFIVDFVVEMGRPERNEQRKHSKLKPSKSRDALLKDVDALFIDC